MPSDNLSDPMLQNAAVRESEAAHEHGKAELDAEEYEACMRAAEILGYERALANLVERPEAVGHTMGSLLLALVKCGGLVNKAKRCISAVD